MTETTPSTQPSTERADDLAAQIALSCFDGGPSLDLLTEVLANRLLATRVLGTLGFLSADMAIAANHGDEALAKQRIIDAFREAS